MTRDELAKTGRHLAELGQNPCKSSLAKAKNPCQLDCELHFRAQLDWPLLWQACDSEGVDVAFKEGSVEAAKTPSDADFFNKINPLCSLVSYAAFVAKGGSDFLGNCEGSA